MEIALVIYGVSWIILLLVFLYAKFKSDNSIEKEPWYLYALIIALAPLVVFLLIPYLLVDGGIKDRRQKNKNKEWEAKKKIEKAHQEEASLGYMFASQNRNSIKATSRQIVIGRSLVALAQMEQYDRFLKCLDKLSLPKGYTLLVDKAKHEGLGDKSNLYVKTSDGIDNYNYFEHIEVEDSLDGAWQAYLLYSLWHILPTFWHGGYDSRTYIFSKEDLKDLRTIEESDQWVVNQLTAYDLSPEVVKSDINNKYYVTCCFWSDWGGLIRELVEVTIEDNKVVDIFEVQNKSEFAYDCGILY